MKVSGRAFAHIAQFHPELTASATAAEAAEVNEREYAAYVSANRTCELGMSRATSREYRHVLEVLDAVA